MLSFVVVQALRENSLAQRGILYKVAPEAEAVNQPLYIDQIMFDGIDGGLGTIINLQLRKILVM